MVTELGHDEDRVALFMFAAILGGTLAQFPIGRLSDRYDRRRVVVLVVIGATVAGAMVTTATVVSYGALAAAALAFGAFNFPLYGLAVAHAHDVLRPDQALEATRGLMLVFGIGAALGPFLAGLVMVALGAAALFGWFALVFGAFALFAMYRLTRTEAVPAAAQCEFAPIFATSQEAVELVDGTPPDAAAAPVADDE